MTDPEILFARRARVAHLALNRPVTLNAITLSMLDRLEAILTDLARDTTLCAVILGGGSRSFSAGADLKELAQDGQGAYASGPGSFPARFGEVLCKLEACPVPVIAAIRGWALAGGLELVLCCDIVIAGRGARFGDAHAKYGLLPSGGSSARLPRRVGMTRASEMILSGDWFSAEAMREAGLVSRLVDDDEVEAEANRFADLLADRSPMGLRRMKSLLLRSRDRPVDECLAAEQREWSSHAASGDMREGLAAFREKRAPRFTGN